jgi:hypothetical protein
MFSVQQVIDRAYHAATDKRAKEVIASIQLYDKCVEPGYRGLYAVGNWNDISIFNPDTNRFDRIDNTPSRLGRILKKMGYELEWKDECTSCDTCGGLVRTQPDSYSWQPSYVENDGEICCHECLSQDPEWYLATIENNPNKALTFNINLDKYGYHQLQGDFEHGFHCGQDADPKVIAKSLRSLGVNRFLFSIDKCGQFDIRFSVWVHEQELKELDMKAWNRANKNGPSVSEGLQRALKDATIKMATLPEGIKVATCDYSTGTATAKTLTPEEFVKGIK